jgi:hypothetical protein
MYILLKSTNRKSVNPQTLWLIRYLKSAYFYDVPVRKLQISNFK